MNNAFDSRLEALAFDYLNVGLLTVLNNIWTWVAIVMGGLSFLISIQKPSISIADLEIQPLEAVPQPNRSVDAPPEAVPEPNTLADAPLEAVPGPNTSADTPALSPRIPSEAYDWTTRKKFTVYYADDDVVEARDECDVEVVCQGQNKLNELRLNTTNSGWEWDRMLRMRILNGEEMGWYHYQDLMVLNGNVVKLWERN